MVKRKAEVSFDTESSLEGPVAAEGLLEVPVVAALETSVREPTGTGLSPVPTCEHSSSIPAIVAEGEALETHPFWALLALAGYRP